MKRLKWDKIRVALDVTLILCSILIIALWVLPRQEGAAPEPNTDDYRSLGEFSTVGVNVTWIGMPLSNVVIEIVNKEFESIYLTETDERGLATIDLSKFENQTYYMKISATVHFVEGGEETKYLWVIFVCNTVSSESFKFNVTLSPELWEEEPTTPIQ